jgi:hypothetical protein
VNRFTYTPKLIEYEKGMSYNEIIKRMNENRKHLEECDDGAAEAGQMVGRYIGHPYADGEAIYQIIKENKQSVRIRVCAGLGDDWVLPAWGAECTIDKGQALQFLGFKDGLKEMGIY